MRAQIATENHPRVVASIPFVEQLARRVAATMPHSIDIGDLVQDGVIGLIDAAHRFDEARGIKFETFAERRIRGAMIDALRKDAWPRGVRRQRRELEAAREELRREIGCEPSLADLAAKMGSDEKRLGRTIVRIHAIESTSPLANNDHLDESTLPAALDAVGAGAAGRCRTSVARPPTVSARAIASLPRASRRSSASTTTREATMKQIGSEIGVNESRVSQLHARAIRRLREALETMMPPAEAREAHAWRNPRVPEAEDGQGFLGAPPPHGRRGQRPGDRRGGDVCGRRCASGARQVAQGIWRDGAEDAARRGRRGRAVAAGRGRVPPPT